MKRYQYIAYYTYYPYGGSQDFKAEGDTLEELREAIKQARVGKTWQHHEVLDLEERRWFTGRELAQLRR